MNFPIEVTYNLLSYDLGALTKKTLTFIANDYESVEALNEAIRDVEFQLKSETECDYIKKEYSYVIDDKHCLAGDVSPTKLVYEYYKESLNTPVDETDIELGDICKLYSNNYESTCIDTAVVIRGFHSTGVYRFREEDWLKIPFSRVDLNYPLSVIRKHLESTGMSCEEYGTFLMNTLASDELRQKVKDLVCENVFGTIFEKNGFNFLKNEDFSNYIGDHQMRAIYEFLIADETYSLGEELESISLNLNSTKAEKMELVKQLLLENGLLHTESETEKGFIKYQSLPFRALVAIMTPLKQLGLFKIT